MVAATTIYLIVIAIILLIEAFIVISIPETSGLRDISTAQRLLMGFTAIFASMVTAYLILKWMKRDPNSEVVAFLFGVVVPPGIFVVFFIAIASIAGVDIGELF